MKKNYMKLGLMSLALLSMTAACTSDDTASDSKSGSPSTKGVTINANISGGDSRVSYAYDTEGLKLTWSKDSDETFTLSDGTNYYDFTHAHIGEALKSFPFTSTTTGTPESFDNKTLYAIYPKQTATSFDFSLADQKGDLSDGATYNLMVAKQTSYTGKTSDLDLSFDNKLAVVRFDPTFTDASGTNLTSGTVTNIGIIGSAIHNKATYDATTDAFEYKDANIGNVVTYGGSFTIGTDGKLDAPAYLMFFPEQLTAGDKIIAFVGNTYYEYTLTSTKQLNAGKVANLSSSVILKPGEAKVGTYCQWDAYSKYVSGSGTWTSGSEGYHTGDASSITATQLCNNCPTSDEITTLISHTSFGCENISTGGGMKWIGNNNGDAAGTTPSVTYYSGRWFLKKAYWSTYTETAATWSAVTHKDYYFFLPAAGYLNGGSYYNVGTYGYYWSSTPYGSSNAYSLNFYSSNAYVDYSLRFYGFLVWSL